MPERFKTSDERLWLSADWKRLLQRSAQRIDVMVREGKLVPQYLTVTGTPVFTQEYVDWMSENSPIIVARLAQLKT